MTTNSTLTRSHRSNAAEVVKALEEYCLELQPGDRIPTRSELMRRFNASERAVLKALDELQRGGRLVLRQGAGTFVAEPSLGGHSQSLVPTTLVDKGTVVAIARPDRAIFDQAMTLLCREAENQGLSLACRFVQGQLPSVTSADEKPLGYILFRRDLLPLARALQEAGNRVVVIGAPQAHEEAGVPNIFGDHETGGYLVARHLLELGHESLAFFGGADLRETKRWQGYERAIREHRKRGRKIESRDFSLSLSELSPASVEKVLSIFRAPDAPTGVAVWNDHEAVILLGYLMRAGIRVPQDVSLVGYDNLREGRIVHPALTTVETALEQQLRAAMDLLTRETPAPPYHSLVVLPTLVCRDSSAPLVR